MRRIAHISDLHFGCADDTVVEALVVELNRTAPDLIVASGDFTQGARHAEFRQARTFLDRLRAPVFSVVGNHDITPYHLIERFFDPYKRFRRYIHPEIEAVWRDDELLVVGVNTARRMAPEKNWSYGRINPGQIARVERLMAEASPDTFKIVVGHHPFLPPPWDPAIRVTKRAGQALAAFARAGVGLVLAGHLHRGYSRFLEPILTGDAVTAVVTKNPQETATRRLLAVQAGSAVSTRLRNEENAYNWIVVEDGRATIEARLWTGSAFEPARAAAAA